MSIYVLKKSSRDLLNKCLNVLLDETYILITHVNITAWFWKNNIWSFKTFNGFNINHNNYNFLKCDWCINCCILLLLINLQSYNQIRVIKQLHEPIILVLSTKSTNYNINYNHYSNQFKRRDFKSIVTVLFQSLV